MRKTRLTALLLAVLLLLSVCLLPSCNAGKDNTPPKDTEGEEKPTDTEKPGDPGDTPTDDPIDTPAERIPYTFTETGEPVGEGIGVNPGRVSWAYAPGAFKWEGSRYWYLEEHFNDALVRSAVKQAICSLAGEEDVNAAFDALFTEFNRRTYGADIPYAKGEKIAIKANMNATSTDENSGNSAKGYYPAPVTLRALLTLLVEYGVSPEDITVYDASRVVPSYVRQMCSEGKLKGVHFASFHANGLWGEDTQPDLDCPVTWSHDIRKDGLPSYNGYPTDNIAYLPTCVTEASYVIDLFNLRGHTLAGFTASAKNHFGSIIPGYEQNGKITFPDAFRANPPSYAGLHKYVAAVDFHYFPAELWDLSKREMGSYNVLVDLLANRELGGKTVLYLCDAFAATVHQGSTLTLQEKWYSAPFSENGARGWTDSFFASQDPIAIDSVMLDFLLAEKAASEAAGDFRFTNQGVLTEGNTAENYLIEAALADNPPSGTYYQDGFGNLVGSLGVHEHWDDPATKRYSRDLGKDEGISLVRIDIR